jgi:2-polyprenyl-3-methyl-5-hydroxy-6-metoxy-1,4-benzoquinol methylase
VSAAPHAPHRRAAVPVADELVVPDRSLELLRGGARVAVVGRGVGEAAIRLAERFPLSSVHGFDVDVPAIESARGAATAAGVAARCHFAVAAPDDVPAGGYALILLLECLDDTGDARAVARRARKVIARDGVVLVVERIGVADPDAVRRVLSASGFAITEATSTELTHVVAADIAAGVR